MVYDEILSQGNDIKSFKITRELLLYCKSAYRKYKEELDGNKRTEQSEKSSKRKLLNDKLLTVKKKEESLVKSLREDSDVFVKEAVETEDIAKKKTMIMKVNYFKDTAKKKEEVICELNFAIEKLEDEIQAL